MAKSSLVIHISSAWLNSLGLVGPSGEPFVVASQSWYRVDLVFLLVIRKAVILVLVAGKRVVLVVVHAVVLVRSSEHSSRSASSNGWDSRTLVSRRVVLSTV